MEVQLPVENLETSINLITLLKSYKYTISLTICLCAALILYIFLFKKETISKYNDDTRMNTLSEFNKDIDDKKILIITNKNCIWCKKLKEDLHNKISSLKEYNRVIVFLEVSNDGSLKLEYLDNKQVSELDSYLFKKFYESELYKLKGFPTIVTRNKVITGYIEDSETLNKIFEFN